MTERATLGGGCFWCIEAVFQETKGIEEVVSGYAGGHKANPSYQEVCSGQTGHAEVCQLTFDANIISYAKILEIFWKLHDPTTPDRQGNDIGTQYRSIIFCHNESQKALALSCRKKLDASEIFDDPIVTQIKDLDETKSDACFYPAEQYHQNYYRNHPEQSYCQFIIGPKLEKFRKIFQSN